MDLWQKIQTSIGFHPDTSTFITRSCPLAFGLLVRRLGIHFLAQLCYYLLSVRSNHWLSLFRFLCNASATCQITLVLVGLAMLEITIAIFKLMLMKMKLRRLWRFMVLATYLLILPSLHTCDFLDALLPVVLTGWKRHSLVIGVATSLTLFGYYLLFSLLLGMDTTTLRLLNRSLFLGPLSSHPSLQAMAGTASFGDLSFHILRGCEAIISAIWHTVSAIQLVMRLFIIHPFSSCTIAGWLWIVAETVL